MPNRTEVEQTKMSVEQQAQQEQQEEHTRELLDRWNSIITLCEKEIAYKIELANKQDNSKAKLTNKRRDEILRDDLWDQYRQHRNSKLCSRCGQYQSYSILQSESSIIGEIHRFDLYSGSIRPFKIEYKLTSELITNPNNLVDEPFYNVCKPCQLHITGKKPYPLSSNLEEINHELNRLRKAEGKRRYKQEDDLKEIRAEILKKKKLEAEIEAEDDNKDEDTITNPKKKKAPTIRGKIGNILQGGFTK